MRRTGSPISRSILSISLITKLLVNFWSKLYLKSLFPNEWYHRSPCFPLHCAINNLRLNIPFFSTNDMFSLYDPLLFARLPEPCLFTNVMVRQISAPYLHCTIRWSTVGYTIYFSILSMPSGGNTFFPSPR